MLSESRLQSEQERLEGSLVIGISFLPDVRLQD